MDDIGELHAREAPEKGDIAYDREMWEEALRLFQESPHHDPTYAYTYLQLASPTPTRRSTTPPTGTGREGAEA